ncbi:MULTISPECIES: autotransporter outer membrane beta-barrel domain-containing protein [Stenotrophomonas]|jgi:autotransporter family porin|uniref:autotransporter family protein n=1 Tax=Stenotrophomonas TaxID=40323 RepID=UPI00201CEE56|nr:MULTISPECIES: autotransporter outer membrane beta-barrel domain-containing protein [Stenotrophomonas]MBN5026329.1 pertactin family autotransporter [Stenotrophomonas maltophilia]MDH1484416.1 autotransporter outer membrane beta-barrel domain-containing protein [Stenotrophomonas sp. GD03712]UQY93975.1 autotransporter outer membrane beta-barrel domain-containing protein [Stenotrophomonas maltophilia]WON69346.1 autotransporter outer membrane beta-barrel domain-containing protein [Stenotrophomonas
MKLTSKPRHDRLSTARPSLLACCLLTGLASTTFNTQARELVDDAAQVLPGHPAESWRLLQGSHLQVNGGETLGIEVFDGSSVVLLNAVARLPDQSGQYTTIQLAGTSSLAAHDSSILGRGLVLADAASAQLFGSNVQVTRATGLGAFDMYSVGIDLTHSTGAVSGARVELDATHVRVEQTQLQNPGSSGVGLRMAQGHVVVRNGSHIDADHIGMVLYSTGDDLTSSIVIDDSTVIARTGAAIRIATVLLAPEFDITVSNGSRLWGGDGHLLQVGSFVGVPGASRVRFSVDDAQLAGDVASDEASARLGTLDVFLRSKAQIDGRFINVTNASIDSGSTWLMTGDSNVGHLTLGSTGTVALGNASTFNTLNVDQFTGNGGTLLFNTVLGDDTSLTDTLVIAGDANGQANVRVLNAGGAGAKTERGIELIDIGGASNAQFDLLGRAVGGQYEYFLVKDANGNWYLRSQTGAGPDPCVVDPALPECKPIDPVDPVDPIDPINPPVLRPEAGAYLANQFALSQLLRHSYQDRNGASTATDGVRGWARVDTHQSKLGAVDHQLDLRADRSRLQLGADMGVFDEGRGRVGLMGTAARSSAASRSDVTGYSARGKLDGGALGVYSNWANDALYVDASVQRGQFRNRVQGEGLAEERYDSDLWQSSLEAGYRIGIGQIGSTALSLQPELQLVYTDAKTDVHTEANGTVVRAAGNSGLSGRAGLRLQGESRSAVGASVSPYLAANWYRDGAGNGIAFDDEVLKAGIPRNRYELSAGARVQFRSGFSAWGGFGVMRGDSGYREATGNLSVTYRW